MGVMGEWAYTIASGRRAPPERSSSCPPKLSLGSLWPFFAARKPPIPPPGSTRPVLCSGAHRP